MPVTAMFSVLTTYNFTRSGKLLLFVGLLLLLFSCAEENVPTPNAYKFLVGFEHIGDISIVGNATIYTVLAMQYPEADSLSTSILYKVNVYSVEYKTSYKDQPIFASGLVCVPETDISCPMISFQNGTNTKQTSAPTADPFNSLFMLVEGIAGMGYIVTIPDYVGFGSSDEYLHPYYQKETNNRAVIDLFYAAKELVAGNSPMPKASKEVFLMGYSQGGWATLSTVEAFDKQVDTTLQLTAISCGAGAYNLEDVTEYILLQDTFSSPLYLPYYIYSHLNYGSLTSSLSTYFNEPFATRIPNLFDGYHSGSEINEALSFSIDELLTTELRTNFATSTSFEELRNDLIHNSIYAWDINVPIKFFHGTSDNIVPYSESVNMYNEFTKRGKENLTTLIEFNGLNHETAVIPWGLETIAWFNGLKDKMPNE